MKKHIYKSILKILICIFTFFLLSCNLIVNAKDKNVTFNEKQLNTIISNSR